MPLPARRFTGQPQSLPRRWTIPIILPMRGAGTAPLPTDLKVLSGKKVIFSGIIPFDVFKVSNGCCDSAPSELGLALIGPGCGCLATTTTVVYDSDFGMWFSPPLSLCGHTIIFVIRCAFIADPPGFFWFMDILADDIGCLSGFMFADEALEPAEEFPPGTPCDPVDCFAYSTVPGGEPPISSRPYANCCDAAGLLTIHLFDLNPPPPPPPPPPPAPP